MKAKAPSFGFGNLFFFAQPFLHVAVIIHNNRDDSFLRMKSLFIRSFFLLFLVRFDLKTLSSERTTKTRTIKSVPTNDALCCFGFDLFPHLVLSTLLVSKSHPNSHSLLK